MDEWTAKVKSEKYSDFRWRPKTKCGRNKDRTWNRLCRARLKYETMKLTYEHMKDCFDLDWAPWKE